MIYLSLQCLQQRFRRNSVQAFSFPWAIYRCVTANMKVRAQPKSHTFISVRLANQNQHSFIFIR